MGKDEQKTVLLVTSFYLLSCSLETHSESTDEGSNSSCPREVGLCALLPSAELPDYSGCVSFPCFTGGSLVENCSYSVFWPVNTFDLSRQFKIIYVYTGVIKKRHCMRLDDEMRLGHFSLCIYGQFYFQLK